MSRAIKSPWPSANSGNLPRPWPQWLREEVAVAKRREYQDGSFYRKKQPAQPKP